MYFAKNILQIILALVVILYYMIAFFLLGYAFESKIRQKESVSITFSVIMGFFSYYTLFECIAFPMKIMGCSFSMLKYAWIIVIFGVLVCCYIINRNIIRKEIIIYKRKVISEIKWYAFFFLLIIINCVLVISITPETMGVRDDSYYIADVMTSIATNSIQQYDVATGERLTSYVLLYLIPMYPIHGGVIGDLLGLHPIIENKWCGVITILLLSNLVYYLLAQKIYRGNTKKSFWLLYLLAFFNFNYVLWGKATGTFFFYRISEGKGILANLILPCMVLIFWEVSERNGFREWLALELAAVSSFSICMSSVFLVPVAIGCLMFPALVKGKRNVFVPCSLCLLWCIFMLVIYEMLSYGIIQVPVL